MARLQSLRDLRVYQLALREAGNIFEITSAFPKEEMYALTNQVRRSSRAVGAILAEAGARRIYPAAFVDKVNRSLAEAMETQAWLDHALTCGYIDQEAYRQMDDAWQYIGAMLNRMIQRADDFCPPARS